METSQMQDGQAVLGQKYAYATAALLAGVASYVSLLGMEKGLLALFFAWMALRSSPTPVLTARRGWAKLGAVLGAGMVVLVPAALLMFRDRIGDLIAALERLQ